MSFLIWLLNIVKGNKVDYDIIIIIKYIKRYYFNWINEIFKYCLIKNKVSEYVLLEIVRCNLIF